MRHAYEDRPEPSVPPEPRGESPAREPRPDPPPGRRGRHAVRRPSFRTAVLAAGGAAAALTVATGMYVAAPAPAPPEDPRVVAAPAATALAVAAGGAAGQFVQEVVALANAERAKAGCRPLRSEKRLRSAAQGHADDMAARGYYQHDSPEGRDAGDRIRAAGYRWSTWAENIHRGPRTPARAMEDWMESSGHRANILNCSFDEIGVGVALTANGPWWVQNFGSRD